MPISKLILYLIIGWIIYSYFIRKSRNKDKKSGVEDQKKPENGKKKGLDIKDAEYEEIEWKRLESMNTVAQTFFDGKKSRKLNALKIN